MSKDIKDLMKKAKRLSDEKIESAKTGKVKDKPEVKEEPDWMKTEPLGPLKDDDLTEEERDEIEGDIDVGEPEEYWDDDEDYEELTEDDLYQDEHESILNIEKEKEPEVWIKEPEESEDTFEELRYEDLYKIAKNAGLKGFSCFNKPELKKFVKEHVNEDEVLSLLYEKLEEKPKIKQQKIVTEIDGISCVEIIDHNIDILKAKSIAISQYNRLMNKIEITPHMKEAYIWAINKLILHEGANL